MKCVAVSPRSPSLGFVLVGVAVWVVLVTILHTAINGRGPLAPGAQARTLQFHLAREGRKSGSARLAASRP